MFSFISSLGLPKVKPTYSENIVRYLSTTSPLWSIDAKEEGQEDKSEEEEYHSIIKDTERGKGMCLQ